MQLCGERHLRERAGHSAASFHTAASLMYLLYSRMEKLGSEIATVFTHSHIVSLVVSSQRSHLPLLFTLSSHLLGAEELFPNAQLFVRHSSEGRHPSACLEYHSDWDRHSSSSSDSPQSAAACLLGQLGQQGVTLGPPACGVDRCSYTCPVCPCRGESFSALNAEMCFL